MTASSSSRAIPPGRSRPRRAGRQIDDRGFDADVAGTAVEHEIDGVAQFLAHVLPPWSD